MNRETTLKVWGRAMKNYGFQAQFTVDATRALDNLNLISEGEIRPFQH